MIISFNTYFTLHIFHNYYVGEDFYMTQVFLSFSLQKQITSSHQQLFKQ